MPPMMFASLVTVLLYLLFAGVLPTEVSGWNKIDGARASISRSLNA